ncbi:MAG: hypothetical protein N2327_00920 [Caldimicrobium sp.]|nr:hypothetical protein [Caldimicrobium sp.]MCX7872982.1 hypothetical protein [Caldimicrobium sp.]MDW8094601.1 hypothetical protein [Caldimicrobium sp.]
MLPSNTKEKFKALVDRFCRNRGIVLVSVIMIIRIIYDWKDYKIFESKGRECERS